MSKNLISNRFPNKFLLKEESKRDENILDISDSENFQNPFTKIKGNFSKQKRNSNSYIDAFLAKRKLAGDHAQSKSCKSNNKPRDYQHNAQTLKQDKNNSKEKPKKFSNYSNKFMAKCNNNKTEYNKLFTDGTLPSDYYNNYSKDDNKYQKLICPAMKISNINTISNMAENENNEKNSFFDAKKDCELLKSEQPENARIQNGLYKNDNTIRKICKLINTSSNEDISSIKRDQLSMVNDTGSQIIIPEKQSQKKLDSDNINNLQYLSKIDKIPNSNNDRKDINYENYLTIKNSNIPNKKYETIIKNKEKKNQINKNNEVNLKEKFSNDNIQIAKENNMIIGNDTINESKKNNNITSIEILREQNFNIIDTKTSLTKRNNNFSTLIKQNEVSLVFRDIKNKIKNPANDKIEICSNNNFNLYSSGEITNKNVKKMEICPTNNYNYTTLPRNRPNNILYNEKIENKNLNLEITNDNNNLTIKNEKLANKNIGTIFFTSKNTFDSDILISENINNNIAKKNEIVDNKIGIQMNDIINNFLTKIHKNSSSNINTISTDKIIDETKVNINNTNLKQKKKEIIDNLKKQEFFNNTKKTNTLRKQVNKYNNYNSSRANNLLNNIIKSKSPSSINNNKYNIDKDDFFNSNSNLNVHDINLIGDPNKIKLFDETKYYHKFKDNRNRNSCATLRDKFNCGLFSGQNNTSSNKNKNNAHIYLDKVKEDVKNKNINNVINFHNLNGIYDSNITYRKAGNKSSTDNLFRNNIMPVNDMGKFIKTNNF